MGEVKRYDPSEDAYGNSKGMKWSPYGDYVLAEDYDALWAENAELVAALKQYKQDAARYRWLIDEGDDMQWMNIIRVEVDDYPNLTAAIDAAMKGDEC